MSLIEDSPPITAASSLFAASASPSTSPSFFCPSNDGSFIFSPFVSPDTSPPSLSACSLSPSTSSPSPTIFSSLCASFVICSVVFSPSSAVMASMLYDCSSVAHSLPLSSVASLACSFISPSPSFVTGAASVLLFSSPSLPSFPSSVSVGCSADVSLSFPSDVSCSALCPSSAKVGACSEFDSSFASPPDTFPPSRSAQ